MGTEHDKYQDFRPNEFCCLRTSPPLQVSDLYPLHRTAAVFPPRTDDILRYTLGEVTSENLRSRYGLHFVGITRVELNGEDLSCCLNKIESASLRKWP